LAVTKLRTHNLNLIATGAGFFIDESRFEPMTPELINSPIKSDLMLTKNTMTGDESNLQLTINTDRKLLSEEKLK
jgi:hypothetical protein